MQHLLSIQSLSIGFTASAGKADAVLYKDLSFDCRAGEFLCILGRNGAGKTTLLRNILGLAPALSGHVLLDSVDLLSMPPNQRAKRVAYLSTERVWPAFMRVRELVALARYPHQLLSRQTQPEDETMIENALARTGMLHKAQAYVNQLSDGEYQKLMLAQVLAQDTAVIMADEPTSHLDYVYRKAVFKTLQQLAHEAGKAVLISSHELDLVLDYADRVLLLGPEQQYQCLPSNAMRESDLLKTVFEA